jgi:hypothetical protein
VEKPRRDGTDLNGRSLVVNEAKPQTGRDKRNGGRNSRSGGNNRW